MNMADCIIFDVDGTLACSRHRDRFRPASRHGDWSQFIRPDRLAHDAPIELGWRVLAGLAATARPIFVSGRHEASRAVTRAWLVERAAEHGIAIGEPDLRLRPDACRLPSHVLKARHLSIIMREGLRPILAAEDNLVDANVYAAAGISVLLIKRRRVDG